MKWDLFCRVVDNFGDVGVCWRLAADLAARGEQVRLWIDDASALAWMAPHGARGVEVRAWPQGDVDVEPFDVVIETFGCDPPAPFVARMAARRPAPLWINLEYLSAEPYVERSHGLPSPQSGGPGAGLLKWFFYPGFTAYTGGLIREQGLLQRRQAFDAAEWLRSRSIARRPGERVVSLFCYENPALPALLAALADTPTLLLATVGHASRQVATALGASMARGALRAVTLPHLSQLDFDHLLWSADLNLVRGEDSFVRAQWAGVPFLWHAYPQHDGAHQAKLDAFLTRHLDGASGAWAQRCRDLWLRWNGAAGKLQLPPLEPWRAHCQAWCDKLAAHQDLGTQLLSFAREKS
ncbi:MAG TPA: elongation factor P maturation arginine rhamnosyltransferase EarP [Piscinibacter sp.]|nr:elongation factor P maturation arginine rhamnosyltransferase EarP [Piscinibacter sp.]HOY35681.1 elongation factor P maturation arginine rhamnosyltransferase EarP [Piscinibacter sp.]HPG78522.1 elongation factor P maturation arginine rhamnosyltransferase EarP [Piscinibacter sp.]